MTETLVLDAADRLFANLATPALVNAAEAGSWPASLWQTTEEAGFPEALGEGADLAAVGDAVAILHHAGPFRASRRGGANTGGAVDAGAGRAR